MSETDNKQDDNKSKMSHIENFIKDNNQYYNLTSKQLTEKMTNKGLAGLMNLGNTCYMNTAFQCLSNTLPLTQNLLSAQFLDSVNTNTKEFAFLYQYLRLLKALWTENIVFEPKSFKEILGLFDNQFANYDQHDTHEVIISIINKIHTALSYEVNISIDGEPKNELDRLMIKSMESWKKMFKNEYSIINQVFYGQFHSTTSCKNCENKSHTFDPFCYITLPITNKTNTIYDCLEQYTINETLDNINQWKCDKCNTKSTADKKMEIWKTPETLIVTFKRFNYSQQKINKLIVFPTVKPLFLQKWTHGYDKSSSTYELYAVCNHSGGTNGGHYFAFCKNLNGKWYNYNDDLVQEIPTEKVMTQYAYVLFYRKKHSK